MKDYTADIKDELREQYNFENAYRFWSGALRDKNRRWESRRIRMVLKRNEYDRESYDRQEL